MTNHYSRNQPIVSRDTDTTERPSNRSDWFNEFAKSLEKTSVKSKEDDFNTFNRINQVLGNKSKYSSMSEAIFDMKKRTGLLDLINKKATHQGEDFDLEVELGPEPEIFATIPDMKIFIDNYVADRPSTAVDAVTHELLKIRSIKDKLPYSDDVGEDVKRYISDAILVAKSNHPQTENDFNLGKIDMTMDSGETARESNPFALCEDKGMR